VIATVVACGYAGVSVTATENVHRVVAEAITETLSGQVGSSWHFGFGISLAWFLPVLLIAFSIYGLLTWRFGPRAPPDSETRCRECGYILRGISEPRCPECGERI
jgi:rubrerythrin